MGWDGGGGGRQTPIAPPYDVCGYSALKGGAGALLKY